MRDGHGLHEMPWLMTKQVKCIGSSEIHVEKGSVHCSRWAVATTKYKIETPTRVNGE